MGKRIISSFSIILCLLFLFSAGVTFAGANSHAGITIDFNSTTSGDDGENTITGIGPDQPVRIDVYAHDVTALKCYEFDMVIDTSKVLFLNVAFTGAITFEDNILYGAVTSVGLLSGDTISVAYANDTTSDGANGDGLLAEISVRTKSTFTTSTEALFTIISAAYQDTGDLKDHILDLNTYHIDGAINPTDTIPPNAVTDLTATPSGTDSTVTLTWTNPPPGDAVTCLFKYSANAILTEADWEDAILLANADFQGGVTPTPSAGTATVIGLPESNYHFVMKTMDGTPNVSDLSNDAPTVPGYTVSGTVGLADNPSDSSGSQVCVGSLCGNTDSHGAYSISNVSGGTYDIVATHTGYYPDTVAVTVSSDTTVNFSLHPIPTTYTVSGIVGLSDAPADSSGSQVCVGSLCDSADAHGAYSISNVSGGTYDIIATHSGYYPWVLNNVSITGDTTIDFSLIGKPVIGVYPSSLAFDSVQVGSVKSLLFHIFNSGRTALVVDSISSNNSVFATDFSGPDTIAPGDTTDVNVTFAPHIAQDESGTLTISNNDHPVMISLAGTGVAPSIRVEPNSLDFGQVTVGNSFTQVFTIYNDGTADLVVDSIIYPRAYSGIINSATILPGQSLVDSVTFTPPDTLTYEGPVDIYNNDVLKTVQVTGRGTPLPVPKIVVNPTSLPFGDVVVGNSSQLTFTISNEGGATLEVYDIAPPQAYTVSDTSFSIEPGNNEVVTVTFTPPDTGSYMGSIEISNNDEPKTVDVSGRGIVYDLGVTVTSCPDTVYRNVPDTVYVDFTNFGNVTVDEIQVAAWLVPDSAANCTTFTFPGLPPGSTMNMGAELLFDTTASYPITAHLCIKLAEDSNPENDCVQCSFYYNEVPIHRMDPELPQAYSLFQNYPNPFNPLTQIQYSIPRRGWVRLEVYNILGEKVATLVDRVQQPGNYRIGWDARDLRSGIYFCRMEAGAFTFTRRMILLK